MNKFSISIDNGSKRFAVFNDSFQCLWGFHDFKIEADAVMRAKAWIEDNHPGTNFNTDVTVVYPKITKFTAS